MNVNWDMNQYLMILYCKNPADNTGSISTMEVNQRRAQTILRWGKWLEQRLLYLL